MKIPLSMHVTVPDNAEEAATFREEWDPNDWAMTAVFNGNERPNGFRLEHCEDQGWTVIARTIDSDGAVGDRVLDFEDSDPEGLAAEIYQTLADVATIKPPPHAAERSSNRNSSGSATGAARPASRFTRKSSN